MDPACRETVHPNRWKQIVREGDAAPAWLAEDFGADRRRATLLAYLIDLQERLTDEAIHMFCKQIGRLFARAAAACEERHKSSRKETTAALRLFRDTLRVLMEANTNNGDAIEMLRAKVGWRRLVEAQPSVEAMVAEKAVNPLPVAAQHHAGLRRYAPRFPGRLSIPRFASGRLRACRDRIADPDASRESARSASRQISDRTFG